MNPDRYSKLKAAQQVRDEVSMSNMPDTSVRSSALDRLQESMVGASPKPTTQPQDFALLKSKRLKRAGVPYAQVLLDAFKQNLGTDTGVGG